MSTHLSVKIATKKFMLNDEELTVLSNLNFDMSRGQFLSLLGPSGCGKSTLLRMISGLDLDYQGSIRIHGQEINGTGCDRGIVFQESRLLGWRDVEGNVAFALPTNIESTQKKNLIKQALELVGLTEVSRAWPIQLSGGMQKRLALARAIVNVPDLLLMDEPFSALDSFSKFSLQDQVLAIQQREKMSILLVTHDIDEALYMSDRIAILTHRPATICETVEIALRHPIDRTSREYADLRANLLKKVLNSHTPA